MIHDNNMRENMGMTVKLGTQDWNILETSLDFKNVTLCEPKIKCLQRWRTLMLIPLLWWVSIYYKKSHITIICSTIELYYK